MTAAAIAHAAKAILFRVLIPRMTSRIAGLIPGVHRVAIETICAKRGPVPAGITMTGETGGGCACKLSILVTGFAGNADVPSRQREIGFVVVEGGICPASCLVTRAARKGEASRVCIIFFMTIHTLTHHSCRLRFGLMTFLAVYTHVLAVQFECREIVVKRGGSPRVHVVTRQTVRAEAAFVRLILPMTGETVPRRGLQVRQFARVGMAGITIHFHVRARQRERDLAVVKMLVVGVHAIVAGEAVTAPGGQVNIGKIRIEPAVTVHASRGIETGQLFRMAIFANEWLILGSKFVTS